MPYWIKCTLQMPHNDEGLLIYRTGLLPEPKRAHSETFLILCKYNGIDDREWMPFTNDNWEKVNGT